MRTGGCIMFLTIVVIIGLAGIIGNQYSGLRRMEQLQHSLDQINERLEAQQTIAPVMKLDK
ncbi:hypothetical protein H8B09_22875 [Paenibacillus sp. PR3]|uniref:Uncharacterized protein n=2 Tax=Paenibacillus terricola TaxID=2763503 RepID=A0ABR8N273_9BACL|nr:hypothetical protein [Paenibacillus terricola]